MGRDVLSKGSVRRTTTAPPPVRRVSIAISIELLDVGAELGILFVGLPANATHIVQPMDIAVFAPFKSKIRALVQQYMFESGEFVCQC